MSRSAFVLAIAGASVLAGCTTVDFSQPEMELPASYSEGAYIRLASFGGSAGLDSPAEGPSLGILRDQISYGMLRCSRRGARLDLEVAADFTRREGSGRSPDHLLGVATWRDPVSREVVGRHHIDIDVFFDNDYQRVSVNTGAETDGFGSAVPRGQLEAGGGFGGQVCRKAFGWSGAPD